MPLILFPKCLTSACLTSSLICISLIVCLQLFFSFHIFISKLKIDTARHAAALPTYAQCSTGITLFIWNFLSYVFSSFGPYFTSSCFGATSLFGVQAHKNLLSWRRKSYHSQIHKKNKACPKVPRVAMAQTCRTYMQATKLLHFCNTSLSASPSTYILVQGSLRTDNSFHCLLRKT